MGVRVTRLIKKIHQKTGKQVVVLMDGYDAAMRDMIDEERIEPMRRTLAKFLLGFNECETYLRFFFITGVRKFDPQYYFDCLKGIDDISMKEEYATVCGLTELEIQPYIEERIEFIARKSNDEPAEIKSWMKRINKGYHFAWPSAAVFCPYSLLRFLSSGDEGDYWYDKYATSHMLEFLEKYDVHPIELSVLELPKEVFYAPMEQVKSILPWLYQCGYITIREYDNERGIYRLDFPNTEFSTRICRDYLPKYFRAK